MINTAGLQSRFSDAILAIEEFRGEVSVTLKRQTLLPLCSFLRDDPDYSFRFLVDITAVDYPKQTPRFVMVYHLLSHEKSERLRLKVPLISEEPEIESVTAVWPTADWHEREAYDLMGIKFLNHPDLRRILLPDSWECHPLRKDYPLEGRGEE